MANATTTTATHPLLQLVGETEADACALLAQHRVVHRVVQRDGRNMAVIQNMDSDRCSLHIADGAVVSATHDSGEAFPGPAFFERRVPQERVYAGRQRQECSVDLLLPQELSQYLPAGRRSIGTTSDLAE